MDERQGELLRERSTAARMAAGLRLVESPSPGCFTEADLTGLPEPARRYLEGAIAPGAPITRSALLRMRGRIKIGRWLPFQADEVLNPHRGFVWSARIARLITGFDRYRGGEGEMRWRFAGVAPIASGRGPDVSLSAAGRAVGEAMWVPTALLPRQEVDWTSPGPDHACARYALDGVPHSVSYRIDAQGRIVAVEMDRWGDPERTGRWHPHRFGGEITGHRRFGDLLVPATGRIGWYFGTARWPDGAFFEFEVTDLRPLSPE